MRDVVEDGLYTHPHGVGAFVIFADRVLVCVRSEFIPATDDGQDEAGYYEQFAVPTEEEMQDAAYISLRQALDAQLKEEEEERQAFERRRQAELAAIRASGREPDFFDELFAGTSDC